MSVDTKKIEDFQALLDKYKDFKFETVFTKKRMLESYDAYSETIKDRKLHFGFETIDNALGGLRPSEIMTVIMPTNVGKSAFAMNVSYNIASMINMNVVLFSLEMSEIDIFERFLQMQFDMNTYSIERMFEKKDKEFRTKVVEVVERFKNVISVVKVINIDEITSYSLAIEELTERKNSLLIIDYVALIENNNGRGDYDKLTSTMRKLKVIALHLKIPILLLSQTDRVKSREGNLDLYSGKGSGEVENGSQIVFTGERTKEFPVDEFEQQTVNDCEAGITNVITLTNHKKKRGDIPKNTYLIMNKKSLRMTEYIPLTRRETKPPTQHYQESADFK